jgi:uncharacterized DUF497 family protein
VFEWDPAKAASNLTKHGVSFEEALTVFTDPRALDAPSERHSGLERGSFDSGDPLRGGCWWLLIR